MARYVYVVRALSQRDGGWARVFGYFRSERLAWLAVRLIWSMMLLSEDYVTLEVLLTIAF